MSSRLPDTIAATATAETLADRLVALVTITDASLAVPLRYTDNPVTLLTDDPLVYGIVVGGNTYRYALMAAPMPNESEDNAQATTIVIDNVEEDAAPAIRGLSADAEVSLSLVLASMPDVPFVAASGLKIVNRTYALETVTLEISRHANRAGAVDPLEPLAGERQTRRKAPGLHR